MIRKSVVQSKLPNSSPARVSRLVVIALASYALLLVLVTAVVGFWVHDWARDRTIARSPRAIAAWSIHELPTEAAAVASGEQINPADSLAAAPESRGDVTGEILPPINILLLGTDADADGPPRTDTIILLTLDRQTQTAGMLSLPRDLWVPIPSYGTYKINTAYSIGESNSYPGGGAQLIKNTVSSFIGQPVPYYVRVNFRGFVELIDLIGGVEINVPKVIHDTAYPTVDYGVETFYLNAGLQRLDGEAALKYVRTRNVDDDYGRARRQQDVIKAVFEQVLQADMIPSLITKLPTLVYTMRSSIETDIPMATQLELANYARQASLKDIRQLVLDSSYGEETYAVDGAWILLPDREKVRAAVEQFFRAPTITSQENSAVGTALAFVPQQVSQHQSVRIEVLNGTDEPGVAARTRDLLEASGWHVVSIGDADRNDYGQTRLINYSVSAQAVNDLKAVLRVQPAQVEVPADPAWPVDMQIVVGSDLLPRINP